MHDDERIAPVTYLFGAPVDDAAPDGAGSSGASPAAASPAEGHGSELERSIADHPAGSAADWWQGAAGIDERRAPVARLSEVRDEGATIDPDNDLAHGESSDAVDPEAELEAARRHSIRALSRRALSRREVERLLLDRELDEHTVADELDRLESQGLVDDLALAQDLVGRLQERKGLGRSGIAAELTRRLLQPTAIEYALDLIESSEELGRAREIAVKRAGQLRSYDRDTAKRRLSSYLARRGYDGSTVRAAVDYALPDRSTGTGGPRFR